MNNGFPGFPAPPARQATDRLAGEWGLGDDGFDLPLTAFIRRRSDTVTGLAIVAALAALAAVVLPLLLAR